MNLLDKAIAGDILTHNEWKSLVYSDYILDEVVFERLVYTTDVMTIIRYKNSFYGIRWCRAKSQFCNDDFITSYVTEVELKYKVVRNWVIV